jgi:hypothetical protein
MDVMICTTSLAVNVNAGGELASGVVVVAILSGSSG